VQAITDRWYGTDRRWWKLQTEDGLYVLRRDDASGEWEVAAVARTASGRQPIARLADVDLEDVGRTRFAVEVFLVPDAGDPTGARPGVTLLGTLPR